MIKLQHMDQNDKYFFIGSIVLPAVTWWIFIGRRKYSAKGMK